MSVLADAFRKTNEVQFLVEVNANGLIDRIASMDISVPGGYLFHGRLLNEVSVATSFDLDGFKYSVSSVRIDRANDDRFQDNERLRVMDGALGKIWVWTPGLTWSDIEVDGCIFQGTLEKDYHDRAHYCFNLNDLSKVKMGNLPGHSITTNTWPLHRTEGGAGSVAGRAVPIVFGTWSKGAPMLCVDATNFKYVTTYGISKSVDADYTAATVNVYNKDGGVVNASGYAFTQGIDAIGNPCCYFDFDNTQVSNEPLSCSIEGVVDGAGEYTATAGEVIDHPAEIMGYVLEKVSGLSVSQVDRGSIKSIKSIFPGLKYASVINAETPTAAYINRVLSQVMAAMVPRSGGRIGAMWIDMDAMPMGRLIQDHHQIGETAIFRMTPERLIVNRLELKYNYNPTTAAYEGVIDLDRSNNETCRQSFYQYGVEYPKTVECPDIYSEQDAMTIALRHVGIFAFRHYLIDMDVSYADGFDFKEGDCALIQLSELPEPEHERLMSRCVLIEKAYTPRVIKQRWFKINSQSPYEAPGATPYTKHPIFEDTLDAMFEDTEDTEWTKRET